MAVIKSGATADQLTVDPLSKAARVTLYDVGGLAVNPAYGIYSVAINVQPATTLTNGTAYWSMRNTASGGGKSVYLRGMTLNLSQTVVNTNTAASVAPARSIFEFIRFSTATPTGGTALTVVKRRNADATSVVTDVRHNPTGLSMTSVVAEASPFLLTAVTTPGVGFAPAAGNNPAAASYVTQQLDWTNGGEEGRVILAPGEGLTIRANGTLQTSCAVLGMIWWDER